VYALKTVTFAKSTLDSHELDVIRDVCMTTDAQGQVVGSPFIVPVYHYWVEAENPQYDRYCLLMELCDKNLEKEIEHRYKSEVPNPLSEKEIWQIICHIMEGILVCHNLNYTHRDIKPANSISLSELSNISSLVL
jgi:serine/threonine protein kinase